MSDIEQITAIRSQTLARLAELVAEPKPSYRIDGQEVAWAEYLDRLEQTVDWCDAKLAQLRPGVVESRAVT